MPIGGNCTICTDFFGSEQNISATFCGHLFHEGCLAKWLDQCSSHRTCPQCRAKLTTKQIIPKLFINVPESRDEETDPVHLRTELFQCQMQERKLNSENKKLKETAKSLREQNDTLEAIKKTLKKDLKASKHANDFLKERLKLAASAEQEAAAAQTEVEQLREKLKTFERMEFILDAEKQQVTQMMDRFCKSDGNVNASAVKEIATFCVSLKQEYETMKASRNGAKLDGMKLKKSVHQLKQLMLTKDSEQETLKETICSLQQSEEQLTSENKGLRQKLEAMQKAISSPSETRASAISRLLAESPAPQFMTPDTATRADSSTHKRNRAVMENSSPVLKERPTLTPSPANSDVIDLASENDAPHNSKSSSGNQHGLVKSLNSAKTAPMRETTNFESPGTSETKRVCEEFGLKFVKTTSSFKFSAKPEPDFPFLKPQGASLSGLSLKRSSNSSWSSSSKRLNKVPMSSKAKPFTSRPKMPASLRPTISLTKKSCPR